MPVVSVILPSCNSEAWIAEAVRSVLTQTHQDLELIVVDDSSTDNTLGILQEFTKDKRFKLLKRKACSGGPATPRNDGIKNARGEYLAFIDSDDVWHPQKLELQIQFLQKHQLNFLSSLHTNFQKTTPAPRTLDNTDLRVRRKTHQQLLSKNWVVTSSAVVSTHLFDNIKFDESEEYVGIEDYVAWLHLHQRNDIRSAVLCAPLVFYRLRNDSISHSKRTMAIKIFYLLSKYRYQGRPLGLKKYYFFATYAMLSIITRLTQR